VESCRQSESLKQAEDESRLVFFPSAAEDGSVAEVVPQF